MGIISRILSKRKKPSLDEKRALVRQSYLEKHSAEARYESSKRSRAAKISKRMSKRIKKQDTSAKRIGRGAKKIGAGVAKLGTYLGDVAESYYEMEAEPQKKTRKSTSTKKKASTKKSGTKKTGTRKKRGPKKKSPSMSDYDRLQSDLGRFL